MYLHFGRVRKGETISVRVGSSFVSADGARKNLQAEIPDWDFTRVEDEAHRAWQEELSRIQIAGSDPAKTVFYTAMYHALLQPRVYNDVDGSYPRFHDHGAVEKVKARRAQFDDFSIWDIFRAQAPLLMILEPERESEMLQSIITKGEQGGFLPIFPAWNSYTSEMVGDHAAVMIADAWQKGLRGFDIESAYRLIRKNATQEPTDHNEYVDGKGRRALDSYLKYGYIPLEDGIVDAFHKNEQVSRTLEYAYDDAIISKLAASLGHKEDAANFAKRGENWRNVIDAHVGFARGRHVDRSWVAPFDPASRPPWITEGTPAVYTFFVPQDIPGLIQYLGGTNKFIAKLDDLFANNLYDHGNEPSHHIAYLYALAGAPEKTQQHVREILDSQYHDGPAGLAGNDDAGQMSAWYVMSALGFYQVAPGIPDYTLGVPRFDDMTVSLPNHKVLHIEARGAERGKFHVTKILLNGMPITNFQLTHQELMAGGKLEFIFTE
jgi:predicted alpha-1,2-mannosidase